MAQRAGRFDATMFTLPISTHITPDPAAPAAAAPSPLPAPRPAPCTRGGAPPASRRASRRCSSTTPRGRHCGAREATSGGSCQPQIKASTQRMQPAPWPCCAQPSPTLTCSACCPRPAPRLAHPRRPGWRSAGRRTSGRPPPAPLPAAVPAARWGGATRQAVQPPAGRQTAAPAECGRASSAAQPEQPDLGAAAAAGLHPRRCHRLPGTPLEAVRHPGVC